MGNFQKYFVGNLKAQFGHKTLVNISPLNILINGLPTPIKVLAH